MTKNTGHGEGVGENGEDPHLGTAVGAGELTRPCESRAPRQIDACHQSLPLRRSRSGVQ
jgi:hypothetical protein